jgi:hypothetical protein
MKRGHARVDATLAQLRENSPEHLEEKLYNIMPDYVFRFITFVDDNYEKQAVTIYCFNFIPPGLSVVVGQDHDMEAALEEVVLLNPGLIWKKSDDPYAKPEDIAQNRKTQQLDIVAVPPRADVNAAGEKIGLSALDIQAVRKTLGRFEFQMGAIGMFRHDNPLHVCFLSPRSMVFIYGNDHFGTIHINHRHGWFSDGAEWRKEPSGREFLDNPSKLSMHSVPFDEYRRIADEIYQPANRVLSKTEGVFEKYTGACAYEGKKDAVFHLLVYKGTKIVHTLFPQGKQFNRVKKNILNYKKDKLTVDEKPFRHLVIGKQPYYNAEFVIRYIIIVVLNNETGRRQIWIETTTRAGNPMYSVKVQEAEGNQPMDGERFFRGLEFADYSGLEKWIRKFDDGLPGK